MSEHVKWFHYLLFYFSWDLLLFVATGKILSKVEDDAGSAFKKIKQKSDTELKKLKERIAWDEYRVSVANTVQLTYLELTFIEEKFIELPSTLAKLDVV